MMRANPCTAVDAEGKNGMKCAYSSSFSAAVTSAISMPLYSRSVLVAVCLKVAVPTVPSWSSAADTVTVCPVLQFDVVKVSRAGVAPRSGSLSAAGVTETVTAPLGSESSATW